ncbi:SARP family transcriptional regulator [Gordonibacter sp. An230]|uniref:BTAD domain-containing putative transcriptional regulator n=1 Tax=Gordonibacter sp. An230 TaxID=1965592 RepID=UPI000B39312F|nr:BTAD domain-containing putative transcriptional regulator [Gordonibacter sp. An230]OUO90480.1 SARP family transcriptional regulator [Gordonibacter sp. An230]
MPDFLAKAACRGRRPQHLAARRIFPRPDLIAKLLRERHVARFIVAPDGYGKTALALEYADTVYRFEHVIWLDGRSPCFLRDLDRGIVADALLEADREPFLVVIEDVPPLDPARVDALSSDMDRMLDRDCEVLVTCAPTRDAFARHRDRVRLSASDLLLSDAEIDGPRTVAERASRPAASVERAERVAGLAWGRPEEGGFLEGVLHEELPSDVMLSMLSMLVLEHGDFSDVAAFGPFGGDQAEFLAEHYPHLGIDLRRERFSTAGFSVEEVAFAFSSKLGVIASRSLFADRDALASRASDALAARGRFERACGVVRTLASREACATWLADHGGELLDACCLVAACDAYRALGGEGAGRGARLDVDEACRRALLGDRRAACSSARRVAGDPAADPEERAGAALVLAACADGAERHRAQELVAALARMSEEVGGEGSSWEASVSVRSALDSSCAKGAEAWLCWYDRGARGPALAQAAAWVLDSASARCGDGTSAEASASGAPGAGTLPSVERVASIVRARVSRSEGPLGLFDAAAGSSFERACERGALAQPALDARAAHAVRSVEMELYRQRTVVERQERELSRRRRSFATTHPDAFRRDDPADAHTASEPLLTVNLFGGLEVRIGDDPVDAHLLRRQKVKTLLALLVLNRGKEFSRDKLVGLMWPDSNLEAARKNLYGIWSMLRRALTTPEGTCPYLIRQQNGLKLDARLLATDVTQLEEVCRSLLFEPPSFGGWTHVCLQVDERFSEDLLPSDDDNEAIAALRTDYRSRLVDALVSASTRLVAAGAAQEGLWFARAALQRDHTREDAYTALMGAQIAAGQRTAALETYFSCRRFLADGLGIDPSLETMRLYHSIIETEAVFE